MIIGNSMNGKELNRSVLLRLIKEKGSVSRASLSDDYWIEQMNHLKFNRRNDCRRVDSRDWRWGIGDWEETGLSGFKSKWIISWRHINRQWKSNRFD